MIARHLETRAEVTVSMLSVPFDECARFGTAATDAEGRILEFLEKSPRATPLPGAPGRALASMGIYLFDPRVLVEELEADARRPESRHDFGHDLLPALCRRRRVFAYDFAGNRIPGRDGPSGYWRDVGTIESYYSASLDLNAPSPPLDFSPADWPLGPPGRDAASFGFVHRLRGPFGTIEDSSVAESASLDGATVRNSVVGPERLDFRPGGG